MSEPILSGSSRYRYGACVVTEHGSLQLRVVAKATWQRLDDGSWAQALEPRAVRVSDQPHQGHDGCVAYPSDMGGIRPQCDLLIVGDAISEAPTASMDVAVAVFVGSTHHTEDDEPPSDPTSTEETDPELHELSRCVLRAHGPRRYEQRLGTWSFSEPEPVTRQPLCASLAFGGISNDGKRSEARNVAGLGVAARLDDRLDCAAPQLEWADAPLRPDALDGEPAWMGPIPAHSHMRGRHFGTTDELWQQSRLPLLPDDFDPRFNQLAQPRLVFALDPLVGSFIQIDGMTLPQRAPWRFQVPPLELLAVGHYSSGAERVAALQLDTIIASPQAGTGLVEMIARCELPLRDGVGALMRVAVEAA